MSSKRRRYDYHEYISGWMRKVEQRKVLSCKEMKELMPLVRNELKRKDIYFDAHLVEEYVRITEKYFFPLMDDQKFYASLILGLKYKSTDFPLFDEVLIYAGRGWGKNGFVSSLAFFLISKYHSIKKYHVDIVATSEDQAMTSFDEVYSVIEDMGKKGKRLYEYNKTQITDRATRSRFRFRTSNASTKDGGRQGCVIFDEIHAYKNYDTINVFTGGLGKVNAARSIYISSDGDERDGVLDDTLERGRRILQGEDEHGGFLPVIMKLDALREVKNEKMWQKANPRILYSDSLLAQVRKDYAKALQNESLKEAFLTKRMNLPYVSKSVAVTDWDNILYASKEHKREDLRGYECIGGVDFADLQDFAVVGLRFKKNGKNYFTQHTFIHEAAVEFKKYNIDILECVREGWATMIPKEKYPTIPPEFLAEWFIEKARDYNIKRVHCDSFRFGAVRTEFDKAGIESHLVRSGAYSHNLVALPLQQAFAEHKIVLDDDKLMRWYITNVKVETDKKGNKTFLKIEPERRKTDGFFCLLHTLIDDVLEEERNVPIFKTITV